MYQEIKRLADEAIALQNKLQMENALRTISSICEGAPATETMNAEEFEAAALAEHKAARATAGAVLEGFGMAHLKIEGGALHPDEIEGDMTPEQEERQLAAYERDVKAARTKDAVVADVYENVVYGTRDLQARAETPTVTAMAAAATSVTIGEALDLAAAKRQRKGGAKQ